MKDNSSQAGYYIMEGQGSVVAWYGGRSIAKKVEDLDIQLRSYLGFIDDFFRMSNDCVAIAERRDSSQR